jgi:ribosomal protein S18 acetylase RimI-like enzyme
MQIDARRATRPDLTRCSIVLGRAFADYPWTAWTVDCRDHVRRITALQYSSLTEYGLPYGHVWVATVDGTIESVALWMDSAVEIPPTVHERASAANAELEGRRHDASIAAEHEVADWRPDHRHFYLGTVATSPELQGHGLGGRVVRPMLEVADAENVDAFVETSSDANVSFYERLGFATVDHRVISSGGPDVWAMLREPNTG